jgi:hypothetical protein
VPVEASLLREGAETTTQSGIPADVLLGVTAAGLFGVTAAGLFGVTTAGASSVGRALGRGGNGAGRCNGAGRW